MTRPHSILLISSFLPLCWLGMQIVHELGHVIAAILTGGHVERLVLHPLAISRTDVTGGNHPLVVVWAGPALGVLMPLLIWAAAAVARWRGAFLPRFFAGFCLIANGAYIAGGSFAGIGDAGDLLRHGAPRWSLWAFGLLPIPAGLALWNGLGPQFGLGPQAQPLPPRLAWGCLALLALVVIAELAAF